MRRIWRIGIDLDGVVIDHTQNKIMVAKRFGIELSPQDTPLSFITSRVDPATYRTMQKIIYDDPEVALSAPLVEGAENGLAKMREANLPIYLISRRHYTSTTRKLLKKHGIDKYFESIFFVKEKGDKDAVARGLHLDAHLDDEPGVLALMPSVPHRFLFDPLGVHRGNPDYAKVRSWVEFMDRIVAL